VDQNCGLLQRTRHARTFAGREEFSQTRMSPEKTDQNFSRLRARTLRGFLEAII
jgi:hypothetical protein